MTVRWFLTLAMVCGLSSSALADEIILAVDEELEAAPFALLEEAVSRGGHHVVAAHELLPFADRIEAVRDPNYLMRLAELGRVRGTFFSGYSQEVINAIEYWLGLLEDRPWLVVAHPDVAVVTLDSLIIYPRAVMMIDDGIAPEEALARVHRYFWGVPPNPDTVSPQTTGMWDIFNANEGRERAVSVFRGTSECAVFGPGGALEIEEESVHVPAWEVVVRIECENGIRWFELWNEDVESVVLSSAVRPNGEYLEFVESPSVEAMRELAAVSGTTIVSLSRVAGGYELSSSAADARVFVATERALEFSAWETAWDELNRPAEVVVLASGNRRSPTLPIILGAASGAMIGVGIWQESQLADALRDVDTCADSTWCVQVDGMSDYRRDARRHRTFATAAWATAGVTLGATVFATLFNRADRRVEVSPTSHGGQVRVRW